MSHITFMPNVVAPAISIRLLGHSVRSLYAVCACVCVCARVYVYMCCTCRTSTVSSVGIWYQKNIIKSCHNNVYVL